ncbi:MAG: phosphatidate cytidylyltransferase [Armatimonadetes bacterium]|nr:phosphatidate cytidylyltransferase [Armatimonadota bacterium]
MATRIISGLIGVGVFLAVCFCGLLPSLIGVTVLTGLAIREFNRAYSAEIPAESSNYVPVNALLTWVGLLLPMLVYNALQNQVKQSERIEQFSLLLGVLVLVLAFRLRRAFRNEGVLGRLRKSFGIVGMAYVGMLFSSFILLRGISGHLTLRPFPEFDKGAWLMLFTAASVWSTDTFAYFIGKRFGKTPFAPTVSPAKTWEGFLGGFIGAVIVGLLCAQGIGVSLKHGAVVGLIAGTFGPLGDLFESALKRELSIKDFGGIMPGHGGILDRFDSLLFVTPLIYLYLHFIAKI